MTDKNEFVVVRNLVSNKVVFRDDDTNRRYTFNPYEEKKIDKEVLKRLAYSYGGQILLRDYLSVQDKELANTCGVTDDVYEHEYQWEKQDIIDILTVKPLDYLMDALDFAPEGIRQTIADIAVELPLNDVAKRQAIFEKTGFNITNMIDNKQRYEEAMAAEEGEITSKKPSKRRVKEVTNPGRRVQNEESVQE